MKCENGYNIGNETKRLEKKNYLRNGWHGIERVRKVAVFEKEK